MHRDWHGLRNAHSTAQVIPSFPSNNPQRPEHSIRRAHPVWNAAARPAGKKSGAALILTLGFVVLLSAMIVAFFCTTSNTRRETSVYEAGVEVKQLADIATNVVIGQIADATRSWEVPPATPGALGGGARLTFATQPGMIRTYDEKGRPGRAFKLYSSATMVTPAGKEWMAATELDNEVPPDWPTKPALYADMNVPALRADPNGSNTRANIAIGAANRSGCLMSPAARSAANAAKAR